MYFLTKTFQMESGKPRQEVVQYSDEQYHNDPVATRDVDYAINSGTWQVEYFY